jgi:transposase
MRNPLIGFADQSSLRLDPQRNRVIEIRYGHGTAVSRTVFGFIGLGGNDVVMVSDTSTKHSMMSFLEAVRDANPAGEICVILDNARIHHAIDVYCRAHQLGIELVHLPPYNPDLNPIEFGWKDLKRNLAGFLEFDEMINHCEEAALNLFCTRKDSYSKKWLEKFDGVLLDQRLGG